MTVSSTPLQGMQPNNFTGLDKDWQEWQFQPQTYMTVMTSTLVHDINPAETLDGVHSRSRLLFKVLVNRCSGAAGMVL